MPIDPQSVEAFVGVKIAHILGGLAGGTVKALLTRSSWPGAVAAMIVGSLSAAYLTAPIFGAALRYLPISDARPNEYACSYVVGVTGMFIAEGLIRYARRWARDPKLPPAAS